VKTMKTMTSATRSRRAPLTLFVAFAATACAVHPEGETNERDRATAALRELDEGDATKAADDHADVPTELATLPPEPQLRDYLRVAFHSDQELRARYWQWRAALERIPQEASPPNLAFNFSYLFSDENMTAWDRIMLGFSNDLMNNL